MLFIIIFNHKRIVSSFMIKKKDKGKRWGFFQRSLDITDKGPRRKF